MFVVLVCVCARESWVRSPIKREKERARERERERQEYRKRERTVKRL